MKEIGERVGAILDGDEKQVRFFGYGVRVEDEVPVGAGGMGELLVEMGRKNPTILLDSGEKVYGCECWWGSEEKIKKSIGSREVVIVTPAEARKME
jgi:hypothetical protein